MKNLLKKGVSILALSAALSTTMATPTQALSLGGLFGGGGGGGMKCGGGGSLFDALKDIYDGWQYGGLTGVIDAGVDNIDGIMNANLGSLENIFGGGQSGSDIVWNPAPNGTGGTVNNFVQTAGGIVGGNGSGSMGCIVEDKPLRVQGLIHKTERHTLQALISIAQNAFPEAAQAARIVLRELGRQGVPYEYGRALGTHDRIYLDPPEPLMSLEEVARRTGQIIGNKQMAATEIVGVMARQAGAAETDIQTVNRMVQLGQGTLGIRGAIQASTQIGGANHQKLSEIQSALASQAYLQAREAASADQFQRIAFQHRHDVTRDFITGPMPIPGGTPSANGGGGGDVAMSLLGQ